MNHGLHRELKVSQPTAWVMLKRGYHGVYHRMKPKILQGYVTKFANRHKTCRKGAIDQMQTIIGGLTGKRLLWRELISR